MLEEWNQEKIERDYIKAQAEESTTLEYKAAGALGRSDGKKKEITKDVSAMANADGGIIIYGVKEYDEDDRKHLPEKIDPVDRTQFPKEWLEQVINNIRPRIDELIIYPVDINTGPNDVVYVVEIPKSTTAHQARDHRYYKRFNFVSVPMEDYEVRDVMNRAVAPNANVQFSSAIVGSGDEGLIRELQIIVKNQGERVINHFKLEFTFPNLSAIPWQFQGRPMEIPAGRVDHKVGLIVNHITARVEDDAFRIICRSEYVLFPNDEIDLSSRIGLQYWAASRAITQVDNLSVTWSLFADDMKAKCGRISIGDLPAD